MLLKLFLELQNHTVNNKAFTIQIIWFHGIHLSWLLGLPLLHFLSSTFNIGVVTAWTQVYNLISTIAICISNNLQMYHVFLNGLYTSRGLKNMEVCSISTYKSISKCLFIVCWLTLSPSDSPSDEHMNVGDVSCLLFIFSL